jgi:signal transduction histidine kinase
VARATRPGPPQDRILVADLTAPTGPVTNVRRLVERAVRRSQTVTSVEVLAPALLREEWILFPNTPSAAPRPPLTLADVARIPFSGAGGTPQVEERGLALLTVQPVKNRVGQIMGAVVGGQVLNRDPRLLQQYSDIVHSGGASIYLGPICIVTNLDRFGFPPTLGSSLPEATTASLPTLQAPATDRLLVDTVPLDMAYLSLRNSRQEAIGALLVGNPGSRFDDLITDLQKLGQLLQHRSWKIMIAEVVLCGILAVLLTYIMAYRMITPLAKLRDGAGIIGAGDFDHRLDLRTGDELQELAEDFNEMAVRLAEARRQDRLALVGRMAGTIIHDIRNPLTTIRGYAPLLEEDKLSPAERQEFVKVITDSSNRITDMVQDLLDFSRGQERTLQCEPTALSDFLRGLEPLLRRDFERSSVALEWTVRQDGVVPMDPRKMQRVLINLVTNARDAMEEGGKIRLEADVEDGQGILRVIDNGPGIPEEIRDRLFQPFVTHGKRHGTGLGLTICQQFVEAHGGTLEVETATGQGTTFTIRLPLTEEGRRSA